MTRIWNVERAWDGLSVVIVAGGESFTAAQARLIGMARAKDLIRVIAINDAVYPCWYADIAYACDAQWWHFHGPLADFRGIKVGLDAKARIPQPDFLDYLLRNAGCRGFSEATDAVCNGGNSGYQALHLCAHLGARKVILVGYDMRGRHWFGDHPGPLDRGPPIPSLRVKRIEYFRELGEALAERGMTVVNATPGSALDAFPAVDLATELRRLEA